MKTLNLLALHEIASAALERRFDQNSPIPLLPADKLEQIGRHDIWMPPLAFFEAGNQSIHGLAYLVSIARFIAADLLFEIGTYNGLTAFTLARNLETATIHTLDLALNEEPKLPLFPGDRHHLGRGGVRVYEDSSEATRVVQHFGDSATFDFTPFEGRCALVYIDGAHSLEYVENDTSAAMQIVTPEGVIVWDDYWRQVPDVPRFLHSAGIDHLYRLGGTRLVAWIKPAVFDAKSRRS